MQHIGAHESVLDARDTASRETDSVCLGKLTVNGGFGGINIITLVII
jgi:hypothetical protein